jgi:Domain of unknown function (DUF1906)/FG-GAP-like repeat
MSDLWAQFSVQITGVDWSRSSAYPYTPDGPVDDQAYSTQTINGKQYLVSVSTSVADNYEYTNLSIDNASSLLDGIGADQSLMDLLDGEYTDNTWSYTIDARLATSSDDISTLNTVLPVTNFGGFQNEVAELNSGDALSFEGYDLTVKDASDTTVLPSGQEPANVSAPYQVQTITAFGTNIDIYYPQYIWVDLGPASAALSISPSDKTEADVIYNRSFSNTSPPANGSIAFTDTDANAGVFSATITAVNVTATDAKGNSIQLTAQQLGQLQAAISVGEVNSSESDGVTNGSVSWDFSSGGLTTVAPGETAVVTSTVQVSDSDSNSDTATVAVTVTGPTPPTNIIAGFDSQYMPTNMAAIKASTNLSAVGFYLPSAPNYDAKDAPAGGTWEGNLSTLCQEGWQVKPIWVGWQSDADPLIASKNLNFIENNPLQPTDPNYASDQGKSDAKQAVADMQDASGSGNPGFQNGTTVYLDIEDRGQYVSGSLVNYIQAWTTEIAALGYTPGIYSYQSTCTFLVQNAYVPTDTAFWITAAGPSTSNPKLYENTLTSQILTTSPSSTETTFPIYDPSQFLIGSNISGWQYATGPSGGGVSYGPLSNVDLDLFTNTDIPVAQNILWQNADGQASVWDMNGTKIAGGGAVSANPGPSWTEIGTGDFFGGGSSDILWQNTSTGQASIWEMNGNTLTGGGAVTPNPGPAWKAIGTGDFNGDGLSDILWQNASTGQASIWEMSGNNLLGGGAVSPNPGPAWKAIGTGDFNDDGDADILWQNASTGQVSVWEMNGNTLIGGGAVNANPGPAWQVIGTGDFNDDGQSDILLQNKSTGQISIWEMNGNTIIGGGPVSANPGPSWHAVGTGGGGSDILLQNTSGQTSIWDMNGNTIIGGGPVATNPGPSWRVVGLT